MKCKYLTEKLMQVVCMGYKDKCPKTRNKLNITPYCWNVKK